MASHEVAAEWRGRKVRAWVPALLRATQAMLVMGKIDIAELSRAADQVPA